VSWRRLGATGLEALSGAGVFYGAAGSEAQAMEGQQVFVVGAGNSAGQAAIHLAEHAASVTVWLRATVACDERGYLLTGRDLSRSGGSPAGWPLQWPPLFLETSLPGVFAAGDVRHRSIKRVASAVGEGAIAVQLVHEYLAEQAS
jgi:thioredoxin reductase (NADPH)